MRRLFIFILLVSFVGFGGVVLHTTAQNTADVSLTVEPFNPLPGSPATIRLVSYGVDLDQSLINWSYNGTTVASGTGKRTITVTAPAAGSTGLISATVSASGFASASASVLLRPASVDLLWEAADATTPPFYKGKAMLPDGGRLRFTALPAASSSQLSYAWTRNSSALPDVSGFGKSSITLKQNILTGSERIEVAVTGGLFSGAGAVSVIPKATAIVAYKNNDGFIDYANGFTNAIPVRESGAVLHFEPYYFSVPQNISSDIEVVMTSGGQEVGQSTNPIELAIGRPDKGGQSALTVAMNTTLYSLQYTEKAFTILFD